MNQLKTILTALTIILSATTSLAAELGKPMNPDIVKFFNEFSYEKIDLADKFYAEDIYFVDPLGEIKGLKDIKAYYKNLYANVISIRFEFSSVVTQGDEQVGMWTMYLRAKNLNGGNEIAVKGNSHVKYKNGKAVYHRDYFDMGEFIYEHVPVLNSIIGFIKKKLKH